MYLYTEMLSLTTMGHVSPIKTNMLCYFNMYKCETIMHILFHIISLTLGLYVLLLRNVWITTLVSYMYILVVWILDLNRLHLTSFLIYSAWLELI